MLIPSVTTIILLSCLTFQAAADDEKDKVHMRAMLAFNRKELAKSSHYPLLDKEENLSASDLILAVKWETSIHMADQITKGKAVSIDYDYCSKLCIDYGTSAVRKKLSTSTSIVSLSSKTKECQQFCKNYQEEAQNFLAGAEFGLAEKSPNDSCSGTINSTSRKNIKPNVFDGALEKERTFNTGAVHQ